ncbi:MAG: InlB B-repeat-containing protein, partial [Clostridia bacterium]|nr:InlB B-repeat-containing protein [Clostridia bacterium]
GLISGTQDGTEPGFGEDDIYGDSVALNVIKGETAKLKAQPKEGYVFVWWINEDTNEIISMEDTIEVTMDEPLNLVAAFDVDGVRHRINVNIGEGVGQGQLAYTEDGSEPEFNEYHYTSLVLSALEGRTVKLKAKPDEGYKFLFWYDEDKQEIISFEDTLSFEATEGMNITANFDLDVDRVLLKVNTEGMGQIVGDETDDDPQFNDDTPFQSLALNVLPGYTVVIKAKADDGYKFAGWKDAATGKIVSTDDTYYVTVNEAMELVAVFEPIENNNDNNGDNNNDNNSNDDNNDNNSNDDNNNGKTDNSDSNNTPADNKPANNTPANGTNTPVSTPTTGDTTSAAALAAVTLGSLGAVVMLAKKHRKDEE